MLFYCLYCVDDFLDKYIQAPRSISVQSIICHSLIMKTLLHNPYTRSTDHTLSLCVRSRCATNNYVIQVLSLKEKIYVQISTLITPPESCRRCLTITSRKPVITIAKRFLPKTPPFPKIPKPKERPNAELVPFREKSSALIPYNRTNTQPFLTPKNNTNTMLLGKPKSVNDLPDIIQNGRKFSTERDSFLNTSTSGIDINALEVTATIATELSITNLSNNISISSGQGFNNLYKQESFGELKASSLTGKYVLLQMLLEEVIASKQNASTGWGPQKDILLQRLDTFFKHYSIKLEDIELPLSREKIEYDALYNKDSTKALLPYQQEVKEFLFQEKSLICRNPNQYEYNIDLDKKNIELLEKYNDLLYKTDEPVWHELIRRAGSTVNNDASPTMEEMFEIKGDARACGNSYKQGQGSKLVSTMYDIMSRNPNKYFTVAEIQFNEQQKEDILKQAITNNLIAGSIFRENLEKSPYLSGDDLHCLAVVRTSSAYIAVTTLTSADDEGTVQYANINMQDQSKKQFLRPMLYLVYIPENIFVLSDRHTEFINNPNNTFRNQTVPEIFTQAIRDNYPAWKNNIVRQPITFTPDMIKDLAIEVCTDRISSMEKSNYMLKHELNWYKSTEEQKQEKIMKRSKNEENIIRDKKEGAFIKLLPKDVKELFEYKKQLVREKDQHLRQALEEQTNKKNKEKLEEKLKQKTGAK